MDNGESLTYLHKICFRSKIKTEFGKLCDLLEGVHALGEDMVPHHDHDDGDGAVHKGQGPVLQLPSLDTLTVHVGQLLHLPTQQHTA